MLDKRIARQILALPPGSMKFGWLIYGPCEQCGVEAKAPCVGRPNGPHAGRGLLRR